MGEKFYAELITVAVFFEINHMNPYPFIIAFEHKTGTIRI
jgi:hypothetical protein